VSSNDPDALRAAPACDVEHRDDGPVGELLSGVTLISLFIAGLDTAGVDEVPWRRGLE
jgi:hypothetical protein